MTLNTQNDIISEKHREFRNYIKSLHKNFKSEILYDSESFKSVFPVRKPQISETDTDTKIITQKFQKRDIV